MTEGTGTRWSIGVSEGLDAVAFLGALSGAQLYVDEYPAETAEFSARLGADVLTDLASLRAEAAAGGFGLLWPILASILSAAPTDSIDAVIDLTTDMNARVLPGYRLSQLWSAESWAWLTAAVPRLRDVLVAMRGAGFSEFRSRLVGNELEERAGQLGRQLEPFDVIDLQRKLSGKELDSAIEIVLLYFCRPHGVRIQGQRFIQSADFDLMTTVRIAAHELLHPPMDMKGRVATAVLRQVESDDLFARIVREHDPAWGYTTIEGYVNEDVCQALDQLMIEQLSVARNPADRWRRADDGMHVLAAGLYGLLREDRWVEHGGSIEAWLADALEFGPPRARRASSRGRARPRAAGRVPVAAGSAPGLTPDYADQRMAAII